VVNIAPPGAGGVSNNAFTHFNVGPAGVVLNNSASASQTQLAGQVNGNPILSNQPAATILNQVTAPNPSQLLGTLEVAGQGANVIVANPAGITCNGCGFLNANRATLTTGRPQVGPDGRINFDMASGAIRIDGAGLNPTASHRASLTQVDLFARSLHIHAGVWADFQISPSGRLAMIRKPLWYLEKPAHIGFAIRMPRTRCAEAWSLKVCAITWAIPR
jgi:filamentous hemagglutinin